MPRKECKSTFEIAGLDGFHLRSCMKCWSNNVYDCASGYVSGWTSCSKCASGYPQDCAIGLVEVFEKATTVKGIVFHQHIFIEGRVLDYREGAKRVPLANLPIKLSLPNGVIISSQTGADGRFLMKIESAAAAARESTQTAHVHIGDQFFSPVDPESEEQPYYALAILPQSM